MRRPHRLRFLARLVPFLVAVACFAAVEYSLADAQQQFEAGEYQQAIATLRAALSAHSQDARLHDLLARCFYELRDYERAVSSAERAVELDPNNSAYHNWLGRAYGRKAEQAGWFSGFSLAKKTRREFEEAVRLNPSNFSARHDLIEFYLRAPGIVGGGDDKARRQIELLAKIDPVEGHLARAAYWLDQKKPQWAEEEYRLVLEAEPKRLEPYLETANFYLKRSDAAGMARALQAGAQVDPTDRRLGYYRAVAAILAGNHLAEAEQLLKTYLATVPQRSGLPSHASAREWLGRLYERQGRCDAAREEYRAALQIDPRSKNAQEALRGVCK